MAFVSLCLLLATVPLPDTPITLTSTAEPAVRLLKQISDQAKLDLRCSAEAGTEILLVSVQQMPLSKLMTDIAAASSCQWAEIPNGYRLIPDQKLRDREEAEMLVRDTKKILDDIAKQKQDLKDAAAEAGKSDLAAAKDDSEDTAASISLVSEIDPAKLAAMDIGERLVFATNNPTEMQIGLPAESRDVVTRWVERHNKRADYLALNPPAGKHPYVPKRVDGVPFKTLVMVERSSYYSELLIFIRSYDKNGKLLLEGNDALDVSQHYYDRPPMAADNVPIAFSQESQDLLHALALSGTPGFAPMTPTLHRLLSHPEQRDPLDFMARDALLSLAKTKNLPIVADVPDSAFGGGRIGPLWKNVQDLENEPAAGKTLDIQESDGCLLVRPAEPVRNRQRRLDRASLRAVLAATEAQRIASLDAKCAFALKNAQPNSNPLSFSLLRLLLQSADLTGSSAGFEWSWEMMRLYGLMSPAQRLALTGGAKLMFADLDANEASELKRLLFCGAQLKRTDDLALQSERMRAMLTFMDPSDYLTEPTEAMPHGVPRDGFLTCNVKTGQGLQIANSGAGYDDIVYSPEDVAFSELIDEQISKRHPEYAANLKGGMLCRLTDLGFIFHISPQIYTAQLLSDVQIDANEAFTSLDDLSSDFKDQVASALGELRKTKWASFGGPGGNNGNAAPPELVAASKNRS